MAKFRKQPVEIEAITFDELVEFGQSANPASAAEHGGFAWHFHYNGHPLTHENDDCYLIPTLEGTMRMERGDMLITGVAGEIYPCKREIFEATYLPAGVDSAGDDRTANNAVRHTYRVLSDEEKAQMTAFKDAGAAMLNLIGAAGSSRELSLARTKTEEAVMWAVKHITA